MVIKLIGVNKIKMLNIEEPYTKKYAFLQLAFRPFFVAALTFAAVSILIWSLLYLNGWSLPGNHYTSFTWHAHEMIFGYTMAVICGFLLTAIKNWTNVQTLQNSGLLILAILWLLARVLPFVDHEIAMYIAAGCDISFLLMLFFTAITPIIKAKQWMQVGIISKILLITLCNVVFYVGVFTEKDSYERIGLYGAFYLIMALLLTMMRRLIPFFVEKGLGTPFQAKNNKWVDISSLVLFLVFSIADIVNPASQFVAVLAIIQFVLHSYRISGWYHIGIWKKPLLWVLMIAYAWIAIGFLLKALSYWAGISPFLALHGFAYGGLGVITLGMMTRVALGHTGRSVFNPPKMLTIVFVMINFGVFFRIIAPLLDQQHYLWWIGIAQALWILAFTITLVIYFPMLIKARIDKRPG